MEFAGMFGFARAYKVLFRVSAVTIVAAAASACSSVPDWVDPTTWMGDDTAATAPAPDDQAATDQTSAGGKTVAEASDQYPALADMPDKAPPATSTDEQKQVASGLVADRNQAQYSGEALRGGTEAAAPPPAPASAEAAVPASAANAAPSAADQAGTDTNSNPDASPAAATQSASAESTAAGPIPGTLPVEGQSTSGAPARVASATSAVSTTSMPPPPAATRTAAPAAQMAPSDAALGFQPSHAPPLDPQVAQMVVPAGRARHRELASVNPAAPVVAAPMYSAASGPPAAVVAFPQASIVLNGDGRAQVQTAVQAFRAKGGQGYVRVVGHAASGAGNRIQSIERSQALATAVARELIKDGVPARQVLVDAVVDADGDRHADIFLQS
jgi:outer membrane protein OmpA-like peptidoglycan-associated protein